MKRARMLPSVLMLFFAAPALSEAADVSVKSMPPVVVKTSPPAGDTDVDPATTEIKVTFSKPMQDGSWSWSQISDETFPETTGKPRYLEDKRTCVLPVKLSPGRTYVLWLNSNTFHNFKDDGGQPAVPYLLVFETLATGTAAAEQEDESEGSGMIGATIERLLQSAAKRDSKGVIETLHTAAIMVEAAESNADVEIVDFTKLERLLPPEGNREFEGVTIAEVKAQIARMHPSVAIASFTLKLPSLERSTQRLWAAPPPPEILAKMNPQERTLVECIVHGQAPPLTMFALMAKQRGQWKIVAMTFPK